MERIICVSLNRDPVLGEKLGRDIPDELNVELEENSWEKHSALSTVNDIRFKSGE